MSALQYQEYDYRVYIDYGRGLEQFFQLIPLELVEQNKKMFKPYFLQAGFSEGSSEAFADLYVRVGLILGFRGKEIVNGVSKFKELLSRYCNRINCDQFLDANAKRFLFIGFIAYYLILIGFRRYDANNGAYTTLPELKGASLTYFQDDFNNRMKLGVEKYNAVLRQLAAQRGTQNSQMHYNRIPPHLEGQIPPDFQPFPQHPEMLNQPGHQQQIGGGFMNDLNDYIYSGNTQQQPQLQQGYQVQQQGYQVQQQGYSVGYQQQQTKPQGHQRVNPNFQPEPTKSRKMTPEEIEAENRAKVIINKLFEDISTGRYKGTNANTILSMDIRVLKELIKEGIDPKDIVDANMSKSDADKKRTEEPIIDNSTQMANVEETNHNEPSLGGFDEERFTERMNELFKFIKVNTFHFQGKGEIILERVSGMIDSIVNDIKRFGLTPTLLSTMPFRIKDYTFKDKTEQFNALIFLVYGIGFLLNIKQTVLNEAIREYIETDNTKTFKEMLGVVIDFFYDLLINEKPAKLYMEIEKDLNPTPLVEEEFEEEEAEEDEEEEDVEEDNYPFQVKKLSDTDLESAYTNEEQHFNMFRDKLKDKQKDNPKTISIPETSISQGITLNGTKKIVIDENGEVVIDNYETIDDSRARQSIVDNIMELAQQDEDISQEAKDDLRKVTEIKPEPKVEPKPEPKKETVTNPEVDLTEIVKAISKLEDRVSSLTMENSMLLDLVKKQEETLKSTTELLINMGEAMTVQIEPNDELKSISKLIADLKVAYNKSASALSTVRNNTNSILNKVNELANTPNTIKDELAGVKETLQGIDMNIIDTMNSGVKHIKEELSNVLQGKVEVELVKKVRPKKLYKNTNHRIDVKNTLLRSNFGDIEELTTEKVIGLGYTVGKGAVTTKLPLDIPKGIYNLLVTEDKTVNDYLGMENYNGDEYSLYNTFNKIMKQDLDIATKDAVKYVIDLKENIKNAKMVLEKGVNTSIPKEKIEENLNKNVELLSKIVKRFADILVTRKKGNEVEYKEIVRIPAFDSGTDFFNREIASVDLIEPSTLADDSVLKEFQYFVINTQHRLLLFKVVESKYYFIDKLGEKKVDIQIVKSQGSFF